FETNAFAAPILGILAGIAMFSMSWAWIQRCANKAKEKGEGYGDHDDGVEEEIKSEATHLSFFSAIFPLVLVIGINGLLTFLIFPNLDFDTFLKDHFPDINIKGSLGLWAIIVAL